MWRRLKRYTNFRGTASAPVIGPINKGFCEANDRIHPMKNDRRLRVVAQGLLDTIYGGRGHREGKRKHFMVRFMNTGSRRIDRRPIAAPYAEVFHTMREHLQHGVFLKIGYRVEENMEGMALAIQTRTEGNPHTAQQEGISP